MMNSNLLILPILLPLLCALLLVFTKNKNRVSKILYIGTMTVNTLISLVLLIYVMNHKPITLDFGGWKAPFGIQFLGDTLSLLMVTIASFVVTLIMAYGFGPAEKRVNRYYLPTFILFLTTGVIGAFLTSDLFNLYVMFEIMLLASFVLVTLGQSVEQLRAAIIYVVLNIIGSWLFLLGIGLLYKLVGTLNFSQVALRLDDIHNNEMVVVIAIVFMIAFGSKASLVLFMWLPKAYAVLNTELAALFAALMTKVGAYALIRFFTLLFDQHPNITHPILVFMSCITMIIGAFGVIAFKDIKKIAAYHGAIFYLTNDIVVKTLLFFIIGSLVYMSGYREYKYLYGLAKREPFFGVAFIVMIFAIGGVPPFSGFPGKVLIFQGAVQNGNYIGLALMILTSLLAMYSLFRILFIMYFGDADGEQVDYNPLPVHRKCMIGILTVVVLVMGLAAPIVMNVTKNATELNTNDAYFHHLVNPHLKEENK